MDHVELPVTSEAARAVRAGYPIVYRPQLGGRTKALSSGVFVDLLDGRNFVGRGLFDENGPAAVRILSRDRKQEIDAEFWRAGVERSLDLRRTLVNLHHTDAWRAVNSEGDFLPGLVVETYSSYAVLRLETEALRPHLGSILDAVRSTLQPRGLYEKRRAEDGPRGHHLGGSTAPDALPVREGNLRFLARLAEGEQTGFHIDLREARRVLARYARGRQVVNAFSFTGTLSLTAAAAGSPRVVSVDPSPRSTAWSRENFAANGLPPESHEFITGDPGEVLGRIHASTRRFDLAVVENPYFVDPPPAPRGPSGRNSRPRPKKGSSGHSASKKGHGTAKHGGSRAKKGGRRRMAPERRMAPGGGSDGDPQARFRRGYGDLVRAAIGVLQPAGLLACTLHEKDLGFADFLGMLRESAAAMGRNLQVLECHGLPPDFPLNPAYPQGDYMKFVVCTLRA